MNVYIRELKAHKKSLIIWSISIVLLLLYGYQEYTSMAKTGHEELMKFVNIMPKIVQTMWGMSTFDITKPMGYFGVLYPYITIVAAIHSGMIGANIILKEERDKTAEFLMSKPISRNSIITSKMLAALTNVVMFNIVTYITVFIVYKECTFEKDIVMLMIGMFLVQLLFMIIGICFAAISRRSKKSGAIIMSIILSCFTVSMLIDLSDKFDIFKVLTPFKYFEAKDLIIKNSLNVWYIILTFILIIGMLFVTYRRYNKRDLSL